MLSGAQKLAGQRAMESAMLVSRGTFGKEASLNKSSEKPMCWTRTSLGPSERVAGWRVKGRDMVR